MQAAAMHMPIIRKRVLEDDDVFAVLILDLSLILSVELKESELSEGEGLRVWVFAVISAI